MNPQHETQPASVIDQMSLTIRAVLCLLALRYIL